MAKKYYYIFTLLIVQLLVLSISSRSSLANTEDQTSDLSFLSEGTWSIFPSPTEDNLVEIDMVSATDGWAVGGYFTFVRWDGESWKLHAENLLFSHSANSIDMVSSTDGWAGGSQGKLMRWDGENWTEYEHELGTQTIMSIDMVSATDGWAVGSGGIILHWDGDNWNSVNSPTGVVLRTVQMLSSTDGWAVGSATTKVVLHYDGNEWTAVGGVPDDLTHLYGVDAMGPSNVWVTAGIGTFLHWDGSGTWSSWSASDTVTATSIDMLSDTEGWAVGGVGGHSGTVFQWDGTQWTALTITPSEILLDLDMVSDVQGWAVGSGGTILSYSSPPTPFLDLPIDYSDTTFARVVQGNVGRNGGRVNSWVDHNTPDYHLNQRVDLWNGSIYSTNIITGLNAINCSTGLSCYDGHSGVDFQKRILDEPILAAAPGIVITTTTGSSGYGNRVWVDHENGYATLYAHLKSISVSPNETVVSGQPVGIMGNTGVSVGSTGIHLHFGVYYDLNGDGHWTENEVVDPFGWNPLANSAQNDPWTVPSYYLWKYPLNAQTTIDANGGSISSTSGEITANIPSGTLSSPLTFDMWEAPPVADASAQLRSIGFSSWLRVLEWVTEGSNMKTIVAANEFDQPVTITINYSEADLAHLDENQMAIHWWDTINNQWQMLPTTVNIAEKTAMAETTQTGNFDLQTSLFCPADVREPDDNYYIATHVIVDGTVWNQRFDITQDEDWLKFEAIADEIYLVETSNLAFGVDTRLEVYDRDGVTLLALDDNSGEGMGSYLQWVAPRDGIYFVRIAQANSSSYGCDAAYDFSITGSYKVYLPSIMNLP